MDISTAFPGTYLKASDLQDRETTAKMDDVRNEIIGGDEEKPVLYFIGKTKGLVLNKTNANAIADVHGFDTDNWHNKLITIFPTQTDFQGKIVPCIRVKISSKPQPQPQAQPAETQQPGDDTPF